MNRLQVRILVGFVLVLIVTVGIIGAVLMLFLRSRPVPAEPVVNELAATSVQTDFRTLVPARLAENVDSELIETFFADVAAETGFRVLLVRGGGSMPRVAFDSAGNFTTEDNVSFDDQGPIRGQVPPQRQPIFSQGRFEDPDGAHWIFVSRAVFEPQGRRNQGSQQGPPGQQGQQGQNDDNLRYVLASPEPQQTLGTVFDSFGENFLRPLCQAGLVGLGVALGLSVWIARSVARPLRSIAEATGRVASGDYEHRVPVTGPTEARIVGHAFNNMTAQVQFTQQAQQDFLANVTHDLRTPLTSIQGYSQAIIDGVASDAEQASHAATIINDEAGRLNRLVNDLLDIAKIQAGRMQMTRQAVEIEQVLRTVGGSMAVKAGQKGVQLHVQIADLVRIAGDGDRLAQVFTNLVDNAVKHTDSGGQVWLIAKLDEGGVLVTVQDTGEGIPTEDLSRIFERFYQVDKSRNRQRDGAGLGLAITHEIVHAHGGRIWVESEVGVGTRFRVWLPMMSGDRSTVIRMRL